MQVSDVPAAVLHVPAQRALLPARHGRDDCSLPQEDARGDRARNHLQRPQGLRTLNLTQHGRSETFESNPNKFVNGSRVGQVVPVDSCGQVQVLDPSLVNSRNLSRVGQVRPVDSCGQVRSIDPSGSK